MAGYKKVKVPEQTRVVPKDVYDNEMSGEANRTGLTPTDPPMEGTNILPLQDVAVHGPRVMMKKGQLPV